MKKPEKELWKFIGLMLLGFASGTSLLILIAYVASFYS
tara:strand:+ start:103 stop:216 length:114 start_codon:yes stop_codon:yes gene_type:complete